VDRAAGPAIARDNACRDRDPIGVLKALRDSFKTSPHRTIPKGFESPQPTLRERFWREHFQQKAGLLVLSGEMQRTSFWRNTLNRAVASN
jgi:hypothetical protein